MTILRRSRLAATCLLIAAAIALLPLTAAAQSAHLAWAEDLAYNVSASDNAYDGSPTLLTWAGVGGATRYTNRTYCNGFVTGIFKQAYGLTDADIEQWFGSRFPSVLVYHDAILSERRFDRVTTLDEVLPGDILAIRYLDGGATSGHVAILRTRPTLRVSTTPLVPGTYQFEVSVVDSSRSTHGVLDTRMNRDGTWDLGAGIGSMRLYADGDLRVVGHSWSTSSGSAYRPISSYPAVIGRIR